MGIRENGRVPDRALPSGTLARGIMALARSKLLWKETFIASLVAFLGTIATISLVVGVYGMWLMARTGGSPDLEAMSRFSEAFGNKAGTWGSYIAAFIVGFWFRRRHPRASRWNLLLIGFWLADYGLPFLLLFPQSLLLSVRAYLMSLTLYSGLAFAGGLLAEKTMASARLSMRLLRSLSTVTSPQELGQVLGEHRPLSDITHIVLWTPEEDTKEGGFALLTSWTAHPVTLPQRLSTRDCPTLEQARGHSSVTFRVSRLPLTEQHVWERMGIRGGLLIPITEDEGEAPPHQGLLLIGMAHREHVPGRVVRFYEPLVPSLSLTLEKLRLLRQVSETAILQERQRLAREIHDTLAQDFTSIVTHLEAAESALDTDPKLARAHLDRARRAAREGLAEARRVVWALRPDILTRTGLDRALTRVAHRWQEATGIPVHVTITGTPRPLPGDTDVVLLRAAQEALANVHKHARATRVDVTLTYMGDRVSLDVQDDGEGFDPGNLDAHKGFGLRGMRERVEARGGHVIIESGPGEGTTVVVMLPIGSAYT